MAVVDGGIEEIDPALGSRSSRLRVRTVGSLVRLAQVRAEPEAGDLQAGGSAIEPGGRKRGKSSGVTSGALTRGVAWIHSRILTFPASAAIASAAAPSPPGRRPPARTSAPPLPRMCRSN